MRVYDLVKRLLLDIVVGILLLGASLPFMAFAAIGILVSDGAGAVPPGPGLGARESAFPC